MRPLIKACGRPTVAEKQTLWCVYNFVKSYLYLLSIGQIADPEVEIIALSAVAEPFSLRHKSISITDDLGGRFVRVADVILIGTLRFRKNLYQFSVFIENHHGDEIAHFIHILGDSNEAGDAQALLDHLISQAIRTSPYQNESLLASSERNNRGMIGLYEINLGADALPDVFLPEDVRQQLHLFISALSDYDRIRTPLRYLLSGKPGTGKTKIIRAIANACKGKATFLFSNGSEERIDDLFEIASMFSPVVLCIDDVDMLTGSRREGVYNRQLATFLQRLDGFAKADQFLLATTNDKALVDLAAARPGRFDRIIDVSLIGSEHYLSLVKSKTSKELVIEQFNEDILELLERNHVSGAFIATLVKHLELIFTFEPGRLSHDYVASAIKESFDGFYKENKDGRDGVGFRAA